MKDVDWKTLLAASEGGINSQQMIALAFRDLADNADKIGTLNMSPDLLNTLLSADDQSANGKSAKAKTTNRNRNRDR